MALSAVNETLQQTFKKQVYISFQSV